MRLSEELWKVSQGKVDPNGQLYFRPLWWEIAKVTQKSKKKNWVMIKAGRPILLQEGESSVKNKGEFVSSEIDAEDWKKVSVCEAMGVDI